MFSLQIGDSITIFGKSKNPNKSVAMRRSQVIASAPRPAPPERQIPVQRAPINVRQELRSHGVLLNGANKRDSASGNATQDGASVCQPSTSGQGSRGHSSNPADSQVCDEVHTNASGSNTLGAVAMVTDTSDALRNDGNGTISNIQSCSGTSLTRPSPQKANVHSVCNNVAKDSKVLKKSSLNKAHMGQFVTRSNMGMKRAASTKSPANALELKCLCKKEHLMRPSVPKYNMQQYVLNTADVISSGYVTWQPIKEQETDQMSTCGPIRAGLSSQHGPPPETCFSSICEGRAELIMFGGLLEDTNQFSSAGKCAISTVHYAM